MQQYQEIKSRYPGMILFFRLGDFYEMFGDDAVKASKLLEVTLTRRQAVPMCGVPYHAANGYIKKLVKAGEKVAICEQLEEPGQGRGIVRRDVVRVITPGTLLEDNLLDAKQNNYLVAVCPGKDADVFGVAFADISTGEFGATEIAGHKLPAEITRLSPGEIITPQGFNIQPILSATQKGVAVNHTDDYFFLPAEAETKIKEMFNLISLKPLGLDNKPLAAGACGGIIGYLRKTQNGQLPPLTHVKYYSTEDFLILDEAAVRNLELVEGSASHAQDGSLLGAIGLAVTPMGARTLRRWLLAPLVNKTAIVRRQQATAFLLEEGITRRALREEFKNITDIERIVSRVSAQTAGPREIVSLKHSLLALPSLAQKFQSAINPPETILELLKKLSCPQEVTDLIASAIADEPPSTLKESGVIRAGFNASLDELRLIGRDARKMISAMENRERERTGIASLKIGYTSVFGYYLEVTKANLRLVPPDYIRKQTTAGGERFITQELKKFEEQVLSSQEKILRLEDELFNNMRLQLLKHAASLQSIASALAELDVYCAFAEAAALYGFCRPEIDDDYVIAIKDGRHPVIENTIKGSFVPNDILLSSGEDQVIILTGPNMAGKSTYLRQTALIVILAQTGAFVPAAGARIGIVDRIFTRIGSADNLAGGESTFMVEMHETADILRQFTSRSLIILDEVGRGTSTYDGISIARSAVEYLAGKDSAGRGPKVLFATHYFELADLAGTIPGIKNYNVAVKEWQGQVIFLHKITPGAADRSYGIHVAELAGLPRGVISRAHEILRTLESSVNVRQREPDLFTAAPVNIASPYENILVQLRSMDVNAVTPLEALQLLADLKEKLEK